MSYDAAALSAECAVTRESVAERSRPVDFPDFNARQVLETWPSSAVARPDEARRAVRLRAAGLARLAVLTGRACRCADWKGCARRFVPVRVEVPPTARGASAFARAPRSFNPPAASGRRPETAERPTRRLPRPSLSPAVNTRSSSSSATEMAGPSSPIQPSEDGGRASSVVSRTQRRPSSQRAYGAKLSAAKASTYALSFALTGEQGPRGCVIHLDLPGRRER